MATGAEPGGGPSGLRKRETRRFTARLAHIATPTQRTSLHCIYRNHCCKHKALKSVAPKKQFCGSASNTKADSKGKGLRETAI